MNGCGCIAERSPPLPLRGHVRRDDVDWDAMDVHEEQASQRIEMRKKDMRCRLGHAKHDVGTRDAWINMQAGEMAGQRKACASA
jgi:hypothetical protein